MKTRLIIEGNAVYEIDEDCTACIREREEKHELPDADGYDSCYTVSKGSEAQKKDGK